MAVDPPTRPKRDPWLGPFLDRLGSAGSRILELGCGHGLDAATLCDAGFRVVALDRSVAMVREARRVAAAADVMRADLSRPLPFRDGTFGAVVASLSIHYLPWRDTVAVVAEVARVLAPGGAFLFRVNATDDVHHGAGRGEQVEANLYRAAPGGHAELKRFFDRGDLIRLVEGRFGVEHLEHVTLARYEAPKQAWECLARAVG